MSWAGTHRVGLAVAVAAVLAACGSSTTHSGTARSGTAGTPSTGAGAPPTSSTTPSGSAPNRGLTLRPSVVQPGTTVTFGFVAPRSAGRQGSVVISYGLQLSGPAGAGCASARAVSVAGALARRLSEITVGPAQLGGRWCHGTYVARVQETARPYCKPGQMCPQYVRLVGIVGAIRFTVVPA